jgi:IclR family acetate operon transcriptional repressor
MIPVESDLSRDGPPRTSGRRGGRSSEAGNAISKAFRVLEEVAARVGVQQLAEISAAARVPKSSTYRILATLVELGYVIRDHNHEYLAGPRLLALGSEVTSSTASLENLLAGLSAEVGETVHLGLRSGDHAVYIHKVEGRQPYFMASYVGMRLGLHCTAIGKCILAHLPEAEVAAIAERTGLRPRTTATITDPARLADELATIRQRGYGIDNEENERTIRCLGVPVLDAAGAPLGAVSLSTVVFLLELPQLERLAPVVSAVASRVAALLSPPPVTAPSRQPHARLDPQRTRTPNLPTAALL